MKNTRTTKKVKPTTPITAEAIAKVLWTEGEVLARLLNKDEPSRRSVTLAKRNLAEKIDEALVASKSLSPKDAENIGLCIFTLGGLLWKANRFLDA